LLPLPSKNSTNEFETDKKRSEENQFRGEGKE